VSCRITSKRRDEKRTEEKRREEKAGLLKDASMGIHPNPILPYRPFAMGLHQLYDKHEVSLRQVDLRIYFFFGQQFPWHLVIEYVLDKMPTSIHPRLGKEKSELEQKK
jgi:hypothetical protein